MNEQEMIREVAANMTSLKSALNQADLIALDRAQQKRIYKGERDRLNASRGAFNQTATNGFTGYTKRHLYRQNLDNYRAILREAMNAPIKHEGTVMFYDIPTGEAA